MPQQVPLSVYRGDDEHWRLALWRDTAHTVPYDLTDATPKAEVRPTLGSQTVLAALVCTVTLPNTIDVDLFSAESSNLHGKAVWDLQLTFAGTPPRVKTPVVGPVTVTQDVTDSTRV